jgi:hypothetical protein
MKFSELKKQCMERIEFLSLLNKDKSLDYLISDYKAIINNLNNRETNLLYYSVRWNYSAYLTCNGIETYSSLFNYMESHDINDASSLAPVSFYYGDLYITIK